MATINPISRLYDDIVKILDSMVIKYSVKADKYETMETRINAEKYILAKEGRDTFFAYSDYSEEDLRDVIKKNDQFFKTEYGDLFDDIDTYPTEEDVISSSKFNEYYNNFINLCIINPESIPEKFREKLLIRRRKKFIDDYEDMNDYYRLLNGYPSIETPENEYIYLQDIKDDEGNLLYGIYLEKYPELTEYPIHKIEDKLGSFYISLIEGLGVIRYLINKYPDREYLNYIGSKRINIYNARNAKNFSILYLNSNGIMESTYRQFISIYEQARSYFVSTLYIYEYRNLIDYYDNFIALCIFVMTIQQVSVRAVPNAVDREFYDAYSVQLLYETYGIPYNDKIDENTQKQIVQNLNLLIQNKATDKVIIDIASILGFSDLKIYEYYLMKEHLFDNDGKPIFESKLEFDTKTGELKTVYDYEKMFDVHFQKIDIREENKSKAMMDKNNRVEYSELVKYDPFWWEDDELYSEIWEKEYNYTESKYMGLSIPYRLSDMIFQSIILIRMIFDLGINVSDITVNLPKITENPISLPDTIVLLCALMSKKYNLNGDIECTVSKLIHIIEVNNQDIEKESSPFEILRFNFDSFDDEIIDDTIDKLKNYLDSRTYSISIDANGKHHNEFYYNDDLDIKQIQYTVDTSKTDELRTDLNKISENLKKLKNNSTELSDKEKIDALNELYNYSKAIYLFLTYRMSVTDNIDEFHALKTFYDSIYYSNQMHEMFDIGNHTATTFLDYLQHKNVELYDFVNSIENDIIYTYIDHIISRLEMLDNDIDIGKLYLVNDGFSPLQQLLVELITFFKSHTVDMIRLSSLMIVDTKIENILKLIDHIQKVSKSSYIEDRERLYDVIRNIHNNFNLDDTFKLHDSAKILRYGYIPCNDNHINAIRVVDDITDQLVINNESEENDENVISLSELINSTYPLNTYIVDMIDGTFLSLDDAQSICRTANNNFYVYYGYIGNCGFTSSHNPIDYPPWEPIEPGVGPMPS